MRKNKIEEKLKYKEKEMNDKFNEFFDGYILKIKELYKSLTEHIDEYYLKIMVYIISIIMYMTTRVAILKMVPCMILYMFYGRRMAFIFAGMGDILLELDYLMGGVVCFGMSNLLLGPVVDIKRIDMLFVKIGMYIQPFIIYVFGWYFVLIDVYIMTLINLMAGHTLAGYLFIISDVYVFAQYVGYQTSYISLPIYWLAMYLFSQRTEEDELENQEIENDEKKNKREHEKMEEMEYKKKIKKLHEKLGKLE